jgi:hypothetical protein
MEDNDVQPERPYDYRDNACGWKFTGDGINRVRARQTTGGRQWGSQSRSAAAPRAEEHEALGFRFQHGSWAAQGQVQIWAVGRAAIVVGCQKRGPSP